MYRFFWLSVAALVCLTALPLAAVDISGNPQAAFAEARQYLEKGKPREALSIYEALAEAQPNNADYLTELGRTQIILKRALPATWSLRSAIEADESHEEAYRLLVKAYVESGQSERAFEILQEARQRFGEQSWMQDV